VLEVRYALLQLRGGEGINMNEITSLVNDPEALASMRKMMDDPEEMARIREMMNDPDFRSQMTEAMAGGSSEQLQKVREAMAGNEDLKQTLKTIGPSLGPALDILKRSVEDEASFDAASSVLLSCLRNLQQNPQEDKYRRLRLGSEALQSKLLRHEGGKRCLEALGFSEEDGEYLLLPDEHAEDALGMVASHLGLVQEARAEVQQAANFSATHELPFQLMLALPHVMRICAGKDDLGKQVTMLMLQNAEFRAHVNGPAGEVALPSLLQMFQSAQGIQGLLEYYLGAPPPEGTRVQAVGSVSAWKQALENAGSRPVVAFFSSSSHLGCKILAPVYNRLPAAEEFAGLDFLTVELKPDDGLAQQVFDEAFVGASSAPAFLFFTDCLELREWRYLGSDINEIARRLKRIASGNLGDGPEDSA